jgi:hypothetical protein
MIGVTKLILGQPTGLILTLLGVALAVLIYWVIDPKLRAVSHEYEAKQVGYLDELEQKLKWEATPGGGGV